MRNGLLTIDHIDDDVIVTPGFTVVTSGAGGVFPRGLTVGEVVQVFDHASGIGRFATVRPLRDVEAINNVFVITEFENPE
jgi:rod shape-determining protein MreC